MTQFEWFLPFKNHISADMVKAGTIQGSESNSKYHHPASPKTEQKLNVKGAKPPIVNKQCVVYNFQCDLCDARYVGHTIL